MGMFDYVNFKMPCPTCGTEVNEFQSKDLGCDMMTVEPEALMNFYFGPKAAREPALVNIQDGIAVSPPAQPEPVLEKHAQIGGTIFSPGLKVSTLLGRAYREYEYQQTPEREAARIARGKAAMDTILHGTDLPQPQSEVARNLLIEAQAEMKIIASYANDPETNAGLRATAQAYKRVIKNISAFLESEPRPPTAPSSDDPFEDAMRRHCAPRLHTEQPQERAACPVRTR